MIELGEKMENPYSVLSMQKAYRNLHPEDEKKSSFLIDTTHYYVRFLPKNEQELEILKRDSNLILFDYPLLYRIKKGGTYYHDPSLPENQITWQYTVIPKQHPLPDIQFEILEPVFMLDQEQEQGLKSTSINPVDWFALEHEAMRITNNLKPNPKGSLQEKATAWTPKGTIMVKDDYFGIIPLEGVLVRARNILKIREDYTTDKGEFKTSEFTCNDVEMSIKWERWDFDIRDGSYGQAYYVAPNELYKNESWNLTITESLSSKTWLFAHIHRAAFTYYYRHSNWGIKAPPRRAGILGALNQRLHIAGKDTEGRSHYFDFNHFWQAAQVVIFSDRTSSTTRNSSREIFGTTIHELAHASHWEWAYNDAQYVLDWIISDPKVPESYALGVEWKITNDIYGTTGENYYDHKYEYQTIDLASIPLLEGYTPLFIDLMDGLNQSTIRSTRPNDRVIGYTLSQLETSLFFVPQGSSLWWNQLRDRIKDWYNNPTEEHVDYLFENYK